MMRKAKKEQEAADRRLRRERERLEQEIAVLEEKIAQCGERLSDPAIMSNHVRLGEITEEMNEYKVTLDEVFEKWIEIQDE